VIKVKLPNSAHTEVLDISATDFLSLQNQGYCSFHGMIKIPVDGHAQLFRLRCTPSLKKRMVRLLRRYSSIVFILCRTRKSA
jgi:hypothetical protein